MTLNEFSDSFDVLWNNIASNQAPGLNAYDKSVVLTKAEKEIIKNYFMPQSNQKQTGFDGSPKRQSDFAALMKNVVLTVNNTATKFDARSTAYDMPDDLFITINEQITSNASGINSIYTVLPITFDEYGKLMQKPYKYPTKNTAWKLMTSENVAEIIGRFEGTPAYKMRYIKKPKPIILVDLNTIDSSLSIDGISTATQCELSEHLHDEILQRAVEIAKAAYATDANGGQQLQNQITIGSRSE